MKKITVVAAILKKAGKILIAKRKSKLFLEGKWEFPGGKIEPGETPEQCLERELFEEFGIVTKTGDFFAETIHTYESEQKEIRLLCYWSNHINGEFELREHELMAWCDLDEIKNFSLSEADIPIAEMLAEMKNSK